MKFKYPSGYHTGQSHNGKKEAKEGKKMSTNMADLEMYICQTTDILPAAVGCLVDQSQQSISLVDDQSANHECASYCFEQEVPHTLKIRKCHITTLLHLTATVKFIVICGRMWLTMCLVMS